MGIVVDTTRDLDTGVTTVRLDGLLTFAAAPTVRTALAKCASECPTAVVVDLAALHVADPTLLVLFAAAARRAGEQWGVPLLLCGAGPEVGRRIGAFRMFTEVYDSPGSALEALRGWIPRWRHQRFSPVPASAALARHLVAQACTEWGLFDLHNRATLITSELANNAIAHAATAFDVTVSHTTTYLRIAVQDRGPALPPWMAEGATDPAAPDRRLGLFIVDATATGWNTATLADGKVVWALLGARRLGSSQRVDNVASEPPHRHGTAWFRAGVGRHGDGPGAPPDGSSPVQSPMVEDFSDRETEVLGYLRTRLTAGDIAAEMHVPVNVVKAQLRSVYHKLGVSQRQDAVSRAYEWGLLP